MYNTLNNCWLVCISQNFNIRTCLILITKENDVAWYSAHISWTAENQKAFRH